MVEATEEAAMAEEEKGAVATARVTPVAVADTVGGATAVPGDTWAVEAAAAAGAEAAATARATQEAGVGTGGCLRAVLVGRAEEVERVAVAMEAEGWAEAVTLGARRGAMRVKAAMEEVETEAETEAAAMEEAEMAAPLA